MNIKHEIVIALDGIDKHGNKVPRNQDIVVVSSLYDNGLPNSDQDEKCIEKFCEEFKPY